MARAEAEDGCRIPADAAHEIAGELGIERTGNAAIAAARDAIGRRVRNWANCCRTISPKKVGPANETGLPKDVSPKGSAAD